LVYHRRKKGIKKNYFVPLMKQSSDEKITASMAQNKNKYYLVAYPLFPDDRVKKVRREYLM